MYKRQGEKYFFIPTYTYIIPFYPDMPYVVEYEYKEGEETDVYMLGYWEPNPVQEWFCSLFGVEKEDCATSFLKLGADLIFSAEDWNIVVNNEDLNGNPATPTTENYIFCALSILPFAPLAGKTAKLSKPLGKLIKIAKGDTLARDVVCTEKTLKALAIIKNDETKLNKLIKLLEDAKYEDFNSEINSIVEMTCLLYTSDAADE